MNRIYGPIFDDTGKTCCILCVRFLSTIDFRVVVINITNPQIGDSGRIVSYDKKRAWIGSPIVNSKNSMDGIAWDEIRRLK